MWKIGVEDVMEGKWSVGSAVGGEGCGGGGEVLEGCVRRGSVGMGGGWEEGRMGIWCLGEGFRLVTEMNMMRRIVV